jgi:Ca2+-binding EF-hand superfamily protein
MRENAYGKEFNMNNRVGFILVIAFVIMAVVSTSCVSPDKKKSDAESEKIFQMLDKNQDGRISKDEWNSVDTDKNNEITPDEWQKYHFESSKKLKWFDNNGDELMDSEEYLNNFR